MERLRVKNGAVKKVSQMRIDCAQTFRPTLFLSATCKIPQMCKNVMAAVVSFEDMPLLNPIAERCLCDRGRVK